MGVVTSPCCPSPEKGEGMATSPCLLRRRPSPSQGEGRFGESQNRVRSHGLPSTFLSFRAFSFVIPSALFCHSEHFFFVIPNASEESTAWMLRCAQHDRTESVIPNASEESTAWMLRCAQHDNGGKCGCFTSLRSVQHDRIGTWTLRSA